MGLSASEELSWSELCISCPLFCELNEFCWKSYKSEIKLWYQSLNWEQTRRHLSYDGYGIKHADRRYDGYRRDIFLWVFACSTCAICYNCFRSAVTRSFSLTTVPRGLDPEFTDSNYTVPLLALLTLEEIRTRWWSCWANFFDSAWTTTSQVTLHHNIYSKFALSHSKIPDTHLLCCHWEQRFSCWYRGNVVCSDRLPSGTVVLQENFL